MSQKIAPGKWDADKRSKAKWLAPFFGFALMVVGAALFYVLIVNAYQAGRDPSWVFGLVAMVPMVLGLAAVFPNVVVPLIYRALDAADKDK